MATEALTGGTAGTRWGDWRASGLYVRALRNPARTLVAMMVLGEAIRLMLAFTTKGNQFDLQSFRMVRDNLLGGDPLGIYHLDYDVGWQRWPYPPGFFPFVLLANGGANVTGLQFVDVLRGVISLGDLALAFITWSFLRRRGSEERALIAAALILLGPSFIVISGSHGQLDAFAWAPAIAAYCVWEDERYSARRAVYAGALIGVAIMLKSVPGLMLLALLPSARDRREVLTTCVIAGAIPVLSLVPFALGDAHGVRQLSNYHGVPGLGGISLLVQPGFANQWLHLGDINGSLHVNRLNDILLHHGGPLTGLATLGAFGLLAWRRAPASIASLVLVLTLWVFGFNFLLAYAVWGLAILLITGRLREAALLQAALLIPTAMVYGGREFSTEIPTPLVYLVYVPIMLGLLAVFCVSLFRMLSRVVRAPAA
jgi:hypothetical protein